MYSNDTEPHMQLSLLGAHGILTDSDVPELNAAVGRVLMLMSDQAWHTSEEIKNVAGKDGIPASEGLRRMRELRRYGCEIERRRSENGRLFEYRMISVPKNCSGFGSGS